MVRKGGQPISRDKDPIQAFQRGPLRTAGPSEPAAHQIDLLKLRPIDERPEPGHAPSVHPWIVLVVGSQQHVEVAAQAPRSWHGVPEAEKLVQELHLVVIELWSVDDRQLEGDSSFRLQRHLREERVTTHRHIGYKHAPTAPTKQDTPGCANSRQENIVEIRA